MSAPITDRKLDRGWAASPGVRVRQAAAADMPAVRELSLLAGVEIDDELTESVASGAAGQALRAGLAGGQDGFTRYIAEQFVKHWEQPLMAYLSAALVLVAEHRDDGIVGALVAYPPSNITQDHLDAATDADEQQRSQLMMVGAIGIAKIKAVAVTEHARGRHTGNALVTRARQVYFTCGYNLVYGAMTSAPGLDIFYRRCGFEVLDPGEGLDLWAVFGMHSHIEAGPAERFFIRYKPQASSGRNVTGRRHNRKHGKRR